MVDVRIRHNCCMFPAAVMDRARTLVEAGVNVYHVTS